MISLPEYAGLRTLDYDYATGASYGYRANYIFVSVGLHIPREICLPLPIESVDSKRKAFRLLVQSFIEDQWHDELHFRVFSLHAPDAQTEILVSFAVT